MAASRAWHLGRLAIVATFFAVCFVLLARVVGPRSPWLGPLLMFDFMGLAKLAEPLGRLPLPRALRDVASVRPTGGLYRRLGVRGFGTLLRRTPLRHLNGALYLASGRGSAADVSDRAQSVEAIHFWAAVLLTPCIGYAASRGRVAETLSFVGVQVVFNLYPILHLRLVRARLRRCLDRPGTRRRSVVHREGR